MRQPNLRQRLQTSLQIVCLAKRFFRRDKDAQGLVITRQDHEQFAQF